MHCKDSSGNTIAVGNTIRLADGRLVKVTGLLSTTTPVVAASTVQVISAHDAAHSKAGETDGTIVWD